MFSPAIFGAMNNFGAQATGAALNSVSNGGKLLPKQPIGISIKPALAMAAKSSQPTTGLDFKNSLARSINPNVPILQSKPKATEQMPLLDPAKRTGLINSKIKPALANYGIGAQLNRKVTNGVAPNIANGMNLQKKDAPVAALTNNRAVGGRMGRLAKALPEIQTKNPKNPAFDAAAAANASVKGRFGI